MGYSIDQDLEIMKEIERISQEPVNESQYTAVRHGGKPIVESMAVFDDVKVDFNKWTSDNKKVHKAKTVNTGSAKPITKNDTVEEKKKGGQVTEVKNVEMTKKKEQVVEAKQESDGDKAKPAPEVKNFDSKAKSAAASNRAGADKEKHFAEVAKKQKKFKAFIESLVVDEASRQAADTVLAEAEKVFKAQFEAVEAKFEGTGFNDLGGYTDAVRASVERHLNFDPWNDPTHQNKLGKLLDIPTAFKEGKSVKQAANEFIWKYRNYLKQDKEEAFGDKNASMPSVKEAAKVGASVGRMNAPDLIKKGDVFSNADETRATDFAANAHDDPVKRSIEAKNQNAKDLANQFEAIGGGDVVGDGRVETGTYGVNGYTEFNDGWGDSEIVRQSDKAMVLAPTLNAYLNRHGFTGDTWGKWTQEEFDQCFDEAHNNKPFGGQYSAKI